MVVIVLDSKQKIDSTHDANRTIYLVHMLSPTERQQQKKRPNHFKVVHDGGKQNSAHKTLHWHTNHDAHQPE